MKPYNEITNQLPYGLTDKQLDLTPMCNVCGWRKGGLDSWNGSTCKCGIPSATFRYLLRTGRAA